ncbi:hypothetical protein BKA65DRAFT_396913 [Rhexocercosporidium sp. MPI-PUGE-AT-0058]|nr:hypothetical protein BKA65DRAFT_396913 [Rhexocercosporidium sp. MPI-PUGE-AT-0058]
MTANISNILIIGATSGIGEAFTHYFHSVGKTVIAAGRRIDRLNALQAKLKGLEIVQMDISDMSSIESNLNSIFKSFPDLDSIFVCAGKMELGDFTSTAAVNTDLIVSEIITNLAAPLVIARVTVPHLLALKRPTTFITVTSGLAYIPLPQYPVYNATKAGLHNFNVSLRTQLAGTNVALIELAPPYVETELDNHFREENIKAALEKKKPVHPPMPLKDYMDVTIAAFEKGGDKEIGTGFSAMGIGAWRGAFQPILTQFGISG